MLPQLQGISPTLDFSLSGPPCVTAAQQAVIISQETYEKDPSTLAGDVEVEYPVIEQPAEKSNIIFYVIIAVVILIVWRS